MKFLKLLKQNLLYISLTFAASAFALPSFEPENGIPIIDCSQSQLELENSCLLRVPHGYRIQPDSLSQTKLVDKDGVQLKILDAEKIYDSYAQNDTINYYSTSLILIDLSMGPSSVRASQYWANNERDFIANIVENFSEYENIAVYGFGTELIPISDFGVSPAEAAQAIRAIDLTETNTNISSAILDSLEILANQQSAFVKNLYVFSDGEDEGTINRTDEIVNSALAERVSISTIGTYWRQSGDAKIGQAKEYFGIISKPTSGLNYHVNLNQDESIVENFINIAEDIYMFSQEGGIIYFADEVAPVEIRFRLEPSNSANASAYTEEFAVELNPIAYIADEDNDAEHSQGEKAAITSDETSSNWSEFLGGPTWLLPLIFVISILIIILLIWLLFMRKSQHDVPNTAIQRNAQHPNDVMQDALQTQSSGIYLQNTASGQKLPLIIGQNPIGRLPSNRVVINDDSVSRKHALITINAQRMFLEDLGSANGSAVNGKKIQTRAQISLGDNIKLGATNFLLTN